MKVLVLGDSDSSGRFLTGKTWPEVLQRSLSERFEQPSEVVASGFSAVAANAHEFAERRVREVSPDAVVLLLGSFGFTATFTWLRVQRLFGKRAGRWYRGIEERFDAGSRTETGAPGKANAFGRTAVRRLIGAKSYSSRQQVSENYRAVFRALSRFEDTEVVVFAYPGLGKHAREGKGPALRKVFFSEMRAAAAEHHFGWVDGVEIFAGRDADSMKLDDLHFNEAAHALIAAAVEAEIAALRVPG